MSCKVWVLSIGFGGGLEGIGKVGLVAGSEVELEEEINKRGLSAVLRQG